jgi:hypothetical protein
VENYVAKGGKIEDTVGSKCLCNALMANIGHQQTRKDGSLSRPWSRWATTEYVAQFLAPGRRKT